MLETLIFAIIGGVLNRIRGGWLKPTLSGGRTQIARLWWAVPTGVFLWWLTAGSLWLLPAFIVSSFVSYAFLGHGAHMIYNMEWIEKGWRERPNDPQTEWTTFWLPDVYGGTPSPLWTVSKIYLYHLIGMSFIGLLRSAIMLSPIWWTEATFAGSLGLVLSGLLLGPLYWLGWRIRDGATSELIVGAFYWSTFYLVLGT